MADDVPADPGGVSQTSVGGKIANTGERITAHWIRLTTAVLCYVTDLPEE